VVFLSPMDKLYCLPLQSPSILLVIRHKVIASVDTVSLNNRDTLSCKYKFCGFPQSHGQIILSASLQSPSISVVIRHKVISSVEIASLSNLR
jgi:hypothetical protein